MYPRQYQVIFKVYMIEKTAPQCLHLLGEAQIEGDKVVRVSDVRQARSTVSQRAPYSTKNIRAA